MLRAFLTVILTVLLLAATPVSAQQSNLPDFSHWDEVATQAEKLIAGPDASDDDLNKTRQIIVDWRSKMQAAQNANADQIATLQKQLEALGPAPEEGATEDANVTKRRGELQSEISKLEAPQKSADSAYSRADAIIKHIDEVKSMRQAVELARLSPSPLLPSSWVAAIDLGVLLTDNISEEAGQIFSSVSWPELKPRLPKSIGYLLAAVLLLTYGRIWIDSLPSRLSARASEYSRAVVAFIASLGQILLPMLGVALAIRAIKATGLSGPWTVPVLDAIPTAAVILFGGLWLTRQMFPPRAIAYDTLQIDARARTKARRMMHVLVGVFAIHHVLSKSILPLNGLYERLGDDVARVPVDVAEGAVSVWHFVMVVIAAVALFRLGTALRTLKSRPADGATPYRHKLLYVCGVLTRIVVVLIVVMAAMGFINFANMLIWPGTLSLALVALLILLQDFIADLFNMFKRGEEGAREGLAPLLIGFALIVMSIPLFLVIWGARSDDLLEYWTRFTAGYTLGGITLSPKGVLTFLLIFSLGYALTRGLQGALRSSVLPKTRLDAGGQNAVVAGLGYVGIGLAGLMAVTAAGIDLSSLAFIAGALTVGIGFGMQNIVSNFVSGIILLIERPISIGDWIDAGGQQGIVKRISVRSTQVETFDKTEVIVPNSDLITQPVTNWTRHNQTGRIIIPVGVAYGTDTRKVERILTEIIEDQPVVTIDPPPTVLFRGFGADSLDFEIRAILSDVTAGLGTTSEVCHQIAERFAAEGIEIPFAQRDIWLRNPEALRGEPKPEPRIEPVSIPQEMRPSQRGTGVASDDGDSGPGLPDSGDGDGDGGDR